ncbi:MAG: hypothetical protein EOP49_38235, partial [Sphingobacteriales bacterium]
RTRSGIFQRCDLLQILKFREIGCRTRNVILLNRVDDRHTVGSVEEITNRAALQTITRTRSKRRLVVEDHRNRSREHGRNVEDVEATAADDFTISGRARCGSDGINVTISYRNSVGVEFDIGTADRERCQTDITTNSVDDIEQSIARSINDAEAYAKYGQDFDDIRDWRRDNVDQLIKMLGDSIHAHKPNMKFGISPFGIWANKYQNAEGSETSGGSSYYENFADSRRWIKEGWIDYINPQIYWPIRSRAASFSKLIDWWSSNAYNRHLYIGMAPYRILERKDPNFRNPSELPDQLDLIRANPRVQGSVYFSSTSLLRNPLGFADTLSNNYYRYPALPPQMLWLSRKMILVMAGVLILCATI